MNTHKRTNFHLKSIRSRIKGSEIHIYGTVYINTYREVSNLWIMQRKKNLIAINLRNK